MQRTVNVSKFVATVLICALVPAAVSLADENPMTAHTKRMYDGVTKILLETAERMPEENYSFKPVESVRSFGEILGHVAGSQYAFCAAVRGDQNSPKVDKTKTSKADRIAALRDAFAYCDKAYAGLTDKSGSETLKFMNSDMPKLGVLTVNQLHTIEHYGNLVTYMRMKAIVPPSSDPEFMKTVGRN